jgi:hypothetical protein
MMTSYEQEADQHRDDDTNTCHATPRHDAATRQRRPVRHREINRRLRRTSQPQHPHPFIAVCSVLSSRWRAS